MHTVVALCSAYYVLSITVVALCSAYYVLSITVVAQCSSTYNSWRTFATVALQISTL